MVVLRTTGGSETVSGICSGMPAGVVSLRSSWSGESFASASAAAATATTSASALSSDVSILTLDVGGLAALAEAAASASLFRFLELMISARSAARSGVDADEAGMVDLAAREGIALAAAFTDTTFSSGSPYGRASDGECCDNDPGPPLPDMATRSGLR